MTTFPRLPIIDGDCRIRGNFSADTMLPVANSVNNASVVSNANVATAKLRHLHSVVYSQESDATAASVDGKTVRVVRGAGTLMDVRAGLVAKSTGDATVAIDVLKNGTTVLSEPITLDETHANYEKVVGAIASAAIAAGDVFEVEVTATAGGGTLGTGVFVSLEFDESAP